jgi:hypothetical protein
MSPARHFEDYLGRRTSHLGVIASDSASSIITLDNETSLWSHKFYLGFLAAALKAAWSTGIKSSWAHYVYL